ncbi:hypothetical protein ACZ87_01997 [Candidatus Erwinia dacicola]|uniref:Uncharacterized protein n=1 Tax=Candidatus Erwinia dacicola TaxID=252393 RepID=A0A328TTV0_9GAMM|nr:hypothetical protein ACZ87_01997 [Candidatus Erwinia dacicola]
MATKCAKLVAQTHINGCAIDTHNWRARLNTQLAVVELGFYIAVT